jgi:hypothetical protein
VKERKTKQTKEKVKETNQRRKGDGRKEGRNESQSVSVSLRCQASDFVLDLDRGNCNGKLFPSDTNKTTRSNSVHLSS